MYKYVVQNIFHLEKGPQRQLFALNARVGTRENNQKCNHRVLLDLYAY
jgi:hypothetical protein